MSFTYTNGSGGLNGATFVVIGDGTSTSVNVPLNAYPVSCGFSSGATHYPSTATVPSIIQVGSVTYVVSSTYNTTTFVISVSIVIQGSNNPPATGAIITIPVTFIYSSV